MSMWREWVSPLLSQWTRGLVPCAIAAAGGAAAALGCVGARRGCCPIYSRFCSCSCFCFRSCLGFCFCLCHRCECFCCCGACECEHVARCCVRRPGAAAGSGACHRAGRWWRCGATVSQRRTAQPCPRHPQSTRQAGGCRRGRRAPVRCWSVTRQPARGEGSRGGGRGAVLPGGG